MIKKDTNLHTVDDVVDAIYQDKSTYLEVLKRMMRVINQRLTSSKAQERPKATTMPYKTAVQAVVATKSSIQTQKKTTTAAVKPKKQLFIYADASQKAKGVVLTQK